jgi:hypothetical protein
MKKAILAMTVLALCQIAAVAAKPTPAAASSDAIAKAKALFARYVQLEHAFDPAQADLYADNAVIVNTRIYPDGKTNRLQIPALRYKKVIRDGMKDARLKGDISNYSNETYTQEGDKVRIKVTRYSVLKKYSSPMSQLVGPDATGKWMILEEESESHL